MGLDQNAQAGNVVGSVQQFFQDQLGDVLNSSNPAIDYGGGMPFQDVSLEQWVQVRVMAFTRPVWGLGPFADRASGGDPGSRGQEGLWLLNVNCFVRPQRTGQATLDNLAIWRLRDTVLSALMPGTRVPVKDYIGTQETIGYLFIDSIMDDREVQDPGREELVQHNLVFAMRWTETWTTK
jgi:hypothetical protein